MKHLGLMLACGVLLVVCLLRDRKERHERSEAEAEQARQRIAEDHRDALVERVHQANQDYLTRQQANERAKEYTRREREKAARFFKDLYGVREHELGVFVPGDDEAQIADVLYTLYCGRVA